MLKTRVFSGNAGILLLILYQNSGRGAKGCLNFNGIIFYENKSCAVTYVLIQNKENLFCSIGFMFP